MSRVSFRCLAIWGVAVSGVVGAAAAADGRDPNPFERAYTTIALDVESPDLCFKISPRAEMRASFNSPGTQIYAERSRCFMYVAVKTLNAYLCREVVARGDAGFSGDYFSRENCEKLVENGKPYNFSTASQPEVTLKAALEVLGYGVAPGHEDDPVAWMTRYAEVRFTANFQHGLARLPDFSTR